MTGAAFSARDHALMARALRLAERGLATTRLNPRVGCVIARDGEIVGEGWHERAGGPHAEVVALREAGDAARELNRGFFSRIERSRPWLRVKLAMSLDGRTALADGSSKWITSEVARADVQRWRARSCAILTGSGTVLADDPRLNVRPEHHPHPNPPLEGEGFLSPLRVVLDRSLRTPRAAHVLDGSVPTLFLHAPDARLVDDRFDRVECVALAGDATGLDLVAMLALLAARGINEVQVEAGPTLCGALLAAGLVDELLLYVAPVLLGDSARPLLALPPLADMASSWKLRVLEQRQVGDDMRLLLRPRTN
jgi:diaminohydroxyphosphoribosylaminopyrimidine deaminase/5-amino-6-(5-phosphoribosylamino)uracil reductase